MNDQLYMDTEAVKQFATQFRDMGQNLQQSGQVLLNCMTMLQTSGMEGVIGEQAMSRYLEGLDPLVTKLADRCLELSTTLDRTVTAHVDGDIRVSTRFN